MKDLLLKGVLVLAIAGIAVIVVFLNYEARVSPPVQVVPRDARPMPCLETTETTVGCPAITETTLRIVLARDRGDAASAQAMARQVWEAAVANPRLKTLTVLAFWDKNRLMDKYGNQPAENPRINPSEPPWV